MNYAAHYDRLIARARGRMLIGYQERHHVLPKCMGGGNGPENIVALTAEEHYVAHQLLVKMYPEARGLANAVVRMAKQCTGNKAYGWLRRKSAEANKGRKVSAEARAAIGNYWRGRKRSPESIAMAVSKRPHLLSSDRAKEMRAMQAAPFIGKTHSIETRKKISEAQLGVRRGPYKPRTAQHRAALSAAHRGKTLSIEHRARIAASVMKAIARRAA